MANDLSCGFFNRLPLHLFFCCDLLKYKGLTPYDVIKECTSFLDDITIIGYYFEVVDGSKFCNVLIKSSFVNLTKEKMEDGVGNYCLGSRGWFGKNKIYGECTCEHKFLNKNTFKYSYDYLQFFIELLKSRQSICYQENKYYYPREITLMSKDYFDEHGNFKMIVDVDGIKYQMKDPRHWMKIKKGV